MKRIALVVVLLLAQLLDVAPWMGGPRGGASTLVRLAEANEVRSRPSERPGQARETDRNATDARVNRVERGEVTRADSFRKQRQLPESLKRSILFKWEYGEHDGRTLRNNVPDNPDLDTIGDHLRLQARLDAPTNERGYVSVYSDLPTAERTTIEALRRNRAEIAEWLRQATTPEFQVETIFPRPVGLAMAVESGRFEGTDRATVVLRRTADGRFSLVESFPSIELPAEPTYTYDAARNPGPLSRKHRNDTIPAKNFFSGRYNESVLTEDLVLYRGGKAGTPLGEWYTRTPPNSEMQVRIDSAVKPRWLDPTTGGQEGTSPIDTLYTIKIPKGTTIYEGPVAYQDGIHVGGPRTSQIFVFEPWRLSGVEVLQQRPLR